uniref:Uncharacterized protein n=1 Tax=Heterorhabditis bacteriophora TaxID=37862 RepID=A0A1I7W6U9_HETBA
MMIFYIGVIIYVRSNASCSYISELNIFIQVRFLFLFCMLRK